MRALFNIPKQNPPTLQEDFKTFYSNEFHLFITKCLQFIPKLRPTTKEALNFKIIKKAKPTSFLIPMVKKLLEYEENPGHSSNGEGKKNEKVKNNKNSPINLPEDVKINLVKDANGNLIQQSKKDLTREKSQNLFDLEDSTLKSRPNLQENAQTAPEMGPPEINLIANEESPRSLAENTELNQSADLMSWLQKQRSP